jgi:hypothetical protein
MDRSKARFRKATTAPAPCSCGTAALGSPAGGERAEHDACEAGKLKFRLDGEKPRGGWMLVESAMRRRSDKEQWLLIKERDDAKTNSMCLRSGPVACFRMALITMRANAPIPERALESASTAPANSREFRHVQRGIASHSGGSPPIEGAVKARLPQKHGNKLAQPHVTQHKGLDPGHAPLLTIESVEALVGAAQMDAIEFHTWSGVVSVLEKPDRMVFDLDPDHILDWDAMIEAAR